MSSKSHTFIPAASGQQLAVWHHDDKPQLSLVLGWLLNPGVGYGHPIVQSLTGVTVKGPGDSTYALMLTSAEAAVFDLGKWDVEMAARFNTAVQDALLIIKHGLKTGSVLIHTDNHSFTVAAGHLIDADLAEWDETGEHLTATVSGSSS